MNEELTILEQNLQNFSMQKHQFAQQLAETQNAIKELATSKESYKIVGNIMIKKDIEELKKELEEKKAQLSMRISALEAQEKKTHEQIKELKSEPESSTSN